MEVSATARAAAWPLASTTPSWPNSPEPASSIGSLPAWRPFSTAVGHRRQPRRVGCAAVWHPGANRSGDFTSGARTNAV